MPGHATSPRRCMCWRAERRVSWHAPGAAAANPPARLFAAETPWRIAGAGGEEGHARLALPRVLARMNAEARSVLALPVAQLRFYRLAVSRRAAVQGPVQRVA